MILYAGTTHDADGGERHWYVSDRDRLPLRCTAYRSFIWSPSRLPWASIRAAIVQVEVEGSRVTWRAGGYEYTTPEECVSTTPGEGR